MKKRTEKVLSLIITILYLLSFPVGVAILGIVFKVDPKGAELKWFAAIWALIGVALLAILSYVMKKARESVKADVFPLGDITFDSWRQALVSAIENRGYKEFYSELDGTNYSLSMYIYPQSRDPLAVITVIKTDALRESICESEADKETDLVKEYLNCRTIRNSINEIKIYCVDKISPYFHTLLDSHMWQDYKLGRLVVGISLDERRIYVGNFADGYGIWLYKKLREQFIAMAGLEGKEPLSKQ